MRRGITPVVAVALLMGMTVVASGGAYAFFTQATQSGMEDASGSLATELQVRSMRCADTSATIGISNTGDRELVADEASVFLYRDGTLLDTVSKDVSGAEVLQPGGFSELEFPFTTFLEPGTRYTVEVSFDDADYSFERPCQGQSGSLIGYWNFDEIDSRTIADLTVNGNDGTFWGMEHNGTMNGLLHNGTLGSGSGSDAADPAWSSDCAVRDCLDFDGTDYVTVPHHQDLNITDAVTVMAWMEPRPGTNHSRLIDDDWINIYWESGVADKRKRPLRAYIKGDDGSRHYADGIAREPIQNVTEGERVHVAVTFNGTHIYQYHDGSVAARSEWTGKLDDGTSDLLIGAYSTGDPRKWNGTIDDVRVYDRALDQDEVAEAWQGEAPRDGIVAYYPLDEGTGQTAYNAAYQAAGMHGQAARFEGGTGRYLEVPDADALDLDESFTWTVWVNLREKSGDDTVFGKSDAYELTVRNGDMKIVSWGDDWHPSYTFPVGEWHHIAVTGNGAGTSRTLYIDGEQVASGGPSYTMSVSSNPLQIGRWPDQDGSGVNGTVDDLRIYDRELSRSEIRADMNGEAPKQGIVASYSMDGPTGREVWNDAFWREGKRGGAIHVDGVNDHARIGCLCERMNGTTAFTVSAWAYPDTLPATAAIAEDQHIINIGADEAYLIMRGNSSNGKWITGTYNVTGSWPEVSSSTAYTAGTWHHVTGVFDGGNTHRLYVDGVLVNSTGAPDTSAFADQPNGSIGSDGSYPFGRYFNGTIDDVRVYDTALEKAQVQALYNATR